MENDMLTNATAIGKNMSSAFDKFMGMMKNRSDYKYEEKQKRLELEDLKAKIDVVKNSDVVMELNKDGTTIYSPLAIDLMNRAGQRLAFQELKKQMNIENTLYETKNILEKEKENGQDVANSEPVKDDFMTQFYNGVGDISDEEMQVIWAKILVGEIKKPGNFSFRTLQNLKTISSDEAKLFEKISSFVIDFEYIPKDEALQEKCGIQFEDLMALEDCGIISLNVLQKTKSVDSVFCNKSIACVFKILNEKNKKSEIIDRGYFLTSFGKELLKVINTNCNNVFFSEHMKSIKSNEMEISFFPVIKWDGESIEIGKQSIIINNS